MLIQTDMTLRYEPTLLPDGITVTADNITLDGNGATLVGNGTGAGIRLNGRHGVTIRNMRILNFEHGIHAADCTGLTLQNCAVSNTAEIPPNTIFLDIFRPIEQPYGGGILLHRVSETTITDCDLQHQMNGVLAYDCVHLTIENCLANYCSGFGFYLNGVRDSVFMGCSADYCCRYNQRENGGHMGADAAGFVIVNRSSHNQFIRNNARLGGDGFFLAGMTHDGTHAPCNDNLFDSNDGSYSPNIAFEATFSSGNIFRNNIASNCNYGFWLGFSTANTLENNHIHANRRAGIAVENGVGMTVRDNDFQRNRYGILLWSKYVERFTHAVPDNDTSRDWTIRNNKFTDERVAVRIAADQDHGVRPNQSHHHCPPPHNHTITDNSFYHCTETVQLENVQLS